LWPVTGLDLVTAPHSKSVAKRRRISKYYSVPVRAQNIERYGSSLKRKHHGAANWHVARESLVAIKA
jgi:hypothetical protein